MFPWWQHLKRFGVLNPSFEDSSRWKRDGKLLVLNNKPEASDQWRFSAPIKALTKLDPNEKLSISGIANANIIDRVDERLDPRGCDAVDYIKNAQILAHHSYYYPIGQTEVLDIQDDGVHFKAWIGNPTPVGGPNGLTEMQHEIRSLIAQGIMKTVSVGFIPKKFRPPQYDNNNVMVEPLVIESWELLEISVVAIPCNQGAFFEMRDAPNNGKSFFMPPPLALNANSERDVAGLLFDVATFTTEESLAYAKRQGFAFDFTAESEDGKHILLGQGDEADFDHDFESLLLNMGVSAVKLKTKRRGEIQAAKVAAMGATDSTKTPGAEAAPATPVKTDATPASDDAETQYRGEVLTLLRGMNEGMKKTIEGIGEVMKHVSKTDAPVADTEEEEDDEEDDEEEVNAEKLFQRLDALEASQVKMGEILEGIALKVYGKKAS